MTRHRSGKFKARRSTEAVPLLASDEVTRAAKVLSDRARAVAAANRSAWVKAHCAAIRASMEPR